MNKILKILVLIVVIVFTTLNSCDDNYLDRTPLYAMSGSLIWQSDANASLAVNGIYTTFARLSWLGSEMYYYVVNVGPDGYTVARNSLGPDHARGVANSRYNIFLYDYRAYYRTVLYANDAIAGLADNPKITEALASRLIGEAKFLRGLSYFYLWQLFGGVPILDKPLAPSETYLPRNTADEVKQLIIDDFTDAAQKLPVSYASADKGRATQGAAIAMLGKTYLYDNQWDNASAQFAKLQISPFSYNLTNEFSDNFFYKTESNSETVFALQFISQAGYGSTMDNKYGYRNHGPNYGEDYATASNIAVNVFTNKDGTQIDKSTMPVPGDYATESDYGTALTNWYQTTFANADPRLHKSIILPGSTFKDSKGVRKLYWPTGTDAMTPPAIKTTWPSNAMLPIRKFVSEGDDCPLNGDCPIDWPLVRYADVLLMYAEAKNEASGPVSQVYDAVNAVRVRAGIVPLPAGLFRDDMRTNIRLERFREFLFETHPYFDVRRWRTAHTNDPIFGLNHDVYDFRYITKLGTKIFREDRDYLWPIPGAEIDINPKVVQNPNW